MIDTKFSMSVHLMTSLAFNFNNLMSSEEIAKGMKTNPSFVRRLIVSLSKAGLVESVRGKSGGVKLAVTPDKITLDKIYDAVAEHKVIGVPKKSPYKACPVSCAMGGILKTISNEIELTTRKQLSTKTVQNLLSEIRQNS